MTAISLGESVSLRVSLARSVLKPMVREDIPPVGTIPTFLCSAEQYGVMLLLCCMTLPLGITPDMKELAQL